MKLFLMLTIFISIQAFASIDLIDTKNAGEVQFLAIGRPAMIKIKGVSHAPITAIKIANNKMSVNSLLALSDLDTGINLRDEHMRDEFLEIKKFPTATLKIENIILPQNFELKPTEIENQNFEGSLTLHGHQQNITGTFSMKKFNELKAKFTLKLTDFGISIPNYLGVVVADTVAIETNIHLTKN